MKLKTGLLVAVMGVGVAACGPSNAPAAGGGAVAPGEAGFTGEWHVSGHIVGPWFTGPDFVPEADADVLGQTLTLTDASAAGPAALTCASATFEAKTVPAEGLFEGRVPERYVATASLGVEQDQVSALVQTCSEAGKAPVTYNMVGKDRMIVAVGDIVYQFDRGPKAAAEAAAAPAAAPAAPAADPAAPATAPAEPAPAAPH
ncbi:MAG TPA: hypothetical protein PLN33_02180 [Hyphomonadaceae bacterium]|nr:hypothetical protein [Hyphomonadaceae bacterium]HPN07142.1 hypothetical protein [Hyphomonadaceae bacterium]